MARDRSASRIRVRRRVVYIHRVSRPSGVAANMSLVALVVVGDGQGGTLMWQGRSAEVPLAIQKERRGRKEHVLQGPNVVRTT